MSRPSPYESVPDPRAQRSERAGPGPWVLVLPLLFFAASLAYLLSARSAAPRRAPHEERPSAVLLEQWSGAGLGGRLGARLAPLHAAPELQAWDAAALARRMGLAEGAPFRLELDLAGEPAGSPIDLARLAVHDAAGLALEALPVAPPLERGAVADPLEVLLAAPDALAPGASTSVVLWGRAPQGDVRLVGVGASELSLARHVQESTPRDEALARLESDPTGGGGEAREPR